MNTKFIKGSSILLAIVASSLMVFYGSVFASIPKPRNTLPEEKVAEYDPNSINIYNGSECTSGGYFSDICGSNAKEKYWSALRKYFEPPVAAGIMGNIANEGGLNPVNMASSFPEYRVFDFNTNTWVNGWSWDTFYNQEESPTTGRGFGLGCFGIFSGRTDYLHYINENAPNLLEYFKHPEEYSYNIYGLDYSGYDESGDALIAKIGDNDFNALVDLEVGWMYQTLEKATQYPEDYKLHVDMDYFKGLTDVYEAAGYFARKYENCEHCGSAEVQKIRGDAGQKIYDELKDFNCSGGMSTSRGSVNPNPGGTTDITLIGDSISMQSEKELEEKFPTSFLNKVGGRHAISKGSCNNDEGGLDILEKLIGGSGEIVNQHWTGECESVVISPENLKNNIVWALGTNGNGVDPNSTGPETMERLLNLASGHNLFLVTPYNGISNEAKDYADSVAEMYRKVAEENSNVYVVDWNQAVRDNESTYVTRSDSMAVHPTEEGKKLFASLIFDAVSGSKGCTTYTGEYPEYNLNDERWTHVNYGEPTKNGPRTIGSSGCGVMSMAMLTTVAVGRDVFPDELREFLGNGYYNLTQSTGMVALDKKVCEEYGCEVEQVDYKTREEFLEKAKEYLSKGYMLHMSGGCPDMSACAPFSPGGHYIGIFSIKNDGDTVMVADSTRGNKEYSLKKDIAPIMDPVFSISAIRGPGGGGSCANFCKKASVSLNGLTEDEAKALAEYYNGPETDAADYGFNPYGKRNCVSFSTWFVLKFTSIESFPSGNGKDVANALAVQYNLPSGTEPRPFAVFSTDTGSASGHTGIIVAINGDDIVSVEASYSSNGTGSDAHIEHRSIDYFKNSLYGDVFTYLDSVLDKTELDKIAGGR